MSERGEDLQLAQALVAGSSVAWRQFVERYQGLVYARVVRTVQECQRQLPAADMEDIVAEVFSSLLTNDCAALRRFEGRSRMSTWLTVIARRSCLRHLEKQPRSTSQDDFEETVDPEPVRNSLATLIAQEDAQRVRACLGRMSPGDQQIIRLFFHDDLSYREISKSLNLSINTVGPKLHRAQQRLKALLNEPQTSQTGSRTP